MKNTENLDSILARQVEDQELVKPFACWKCPGTPQFGMFDFAAPAELVVGGKKLEGVLDFGEELEPAVQS